MANGPKCADTAQKYILETARGYVPDGTFEDLTDPSTQYDGEEEWSIGSVFDSKSLREWEEEPQNYDGVREAFQTLDQAYNAVKKTQAGPVTYNKLNGLKAFSDETGEEMPTDNEKTQYNWVSDYIDAGLVRYDSEDSDLLDFEEGELTSAGEDIIESTESLNEEVFSGLETDAEDVYRALSTQGYGRTEQGNGGKIEAFLLYGSGMGHAEISSETDLASSTVRTMAEGLEGDLLTESHMWTPEGRDFAEVMMDQLESIQ